MVDQVLNTYTFLQWKDTTNEIITILGNISSLPISNNISESINEITNRIGTLSSLSTTEQTSIVLALNEVVANIGNLTTLNTTEQTSIVLALNEVLTIIGDLNTLDTIEQSTITGSINENNTKIYKSEDNFEYNHGRFSTETTKVLTISDTTNNLIQGYNGASLTATSKFIDNNTDFGGSAGSLDADSLSLIGAIFTATGRQRRYGYEFYILDVTCSTGVTDQITHLTLTYNPILQNNDVLLGRIGDYVTWSAWLRLKTLNTPANNGIIIGDGNNTETYINGILETDPYLLADTDGWIHVRQHIQLEQEYFNLFPFIAANELDVIQVALPVFSKNKNNIGIHQGII